MVRLGFIVVLVALIGLLVSGLVALRVYEQEIVIEEAALSRAIDTHGRRVQERLSERELLTRVAVGLIRSPQPLHPNALQPLRTSIYAFKTDFVLATWIAHIGPADIAKAEQILAEGGYSRPTIRNIDDAAVTGNLPAAFNVLMDVEPRTTETLALPGRIVDRAPILGPAITAALARRAPAASDPAVLPRTDGDAGILLVAPVFAENGGPLTGFISFSYRLGPLMLSNDEPSLFNVTLRDPRNESLEFSADRNGIVGPPVAVTARATTPLLQGVTFGGRDFVLSYYAKVDPTARAQSLAAIVMIVGIALTSILCGLFGYVAYNNLRLSREIEARISFEARLSSVIAELNHRVKNVLAVIQSIVTRTMRPGADVEQARELLIGRIHAMSHVMSLLSDRHWQGARLKSLLASRAIPHAERIDVLGAGHHRQRTRRAEPLPAVLRAGIAGQRRCRRRQLAYRGALAGDRQGAERALPPEVGRAQRQRGDAARGQRLRNHPARPRRAGSARRHLEALFHRCELRVRNIRADAHRGRQDRNGPHRKTVGIAADAVTERTAPDLALPHHGFAMRRLTMGRYLLLWLLGVPIPILLLIWAFGGLS